MNALSDIHTHPAAFAAELRRQLTARAEAERLGRAAPTIEQIGRGMTGPQHDGATSREHWTRLTRLAALLEAGAIPREVYDAATRWRDDWDTGVEGARAQGSGGGGYSGLADHQLDALDRLRAARVAIGDAAVRLVVLCVVDDMAWHRIAGLLGLAEVLGDRSKVRIEAAARDRVRLALALLCTRTGYGGSAVGGASRIRSGAA